MKVLVLGDDGRAHALVWKLFNSPLVDEVVCAPGNGGTGQLVPSADLDISDSSGVGRWAFDEGFDIIVPASSAALRAGVVDEVISLQISVCGPAQRATAIEGSRCQAKEFLLRHGIPTAPGRPFADLQTAEKYLASQPLPVIIKADNPAGGEEVFHDRYAALTGLRDLFATTAVDAPGDGVVIESYLHGPRIVFSAFTDGRSTVPLLPVRLYDRVEPHDEGPVARGVGAHTSHSRYATMLGDYLHQKLIVPITAALAKDGVPHWGLLGVDCVITGEGPRVTALRWSFREGEAQVVLPRLQDDLLPWAQAMIAQRLHDLPPPTWAPTPTVGIGLFARGYPKYFPTGGVIQGIETLDDGVLAFHSETTNPASLRYTPQSAKRGSLFGLFGETASAAPRVAGGHPLTIVASGATLAGARGIALVNAERVTFEGRSFREDIAAKEFA